MRVVFWLLVGSFLLFSLALLAGWASEPEAKWYLSNGQSVH
jgi:hypothetical protein